MSVFIKPKWKAIWEVAASVQGYLIKKSSIGLNAVNFATDISSCDLWKAIVPFNSLCFTLEIHSIHMQLHKIKQGPNSAHVANR